MDVEPGRLSLLTVPTVAWAGRKPAPDGREQVSPVSSQVWEWCRDAHRLAQASLAPAASAMLCCLELPAVVEVILHPVLVCC